MEIDLNNNENDSFVKPKNYRFNSSFGNKLIIFLI